MNQWIVGNARFTAIADESLSAKIHTGNVETSWKYADKSEGNLGGTLATLDGVDGHRPLPDGLLSRDGWYVIDDSGTPVFADGWLQKRSEKHV